VSDQTSAVIQPTARRHPEPPALAGKGLSQMAGIFGTARASPTVGGTVIEIRVPVRGEGLPVAGSFPGRASFDSKGLPIIIRRGSNFRSFGIGRWQRFMEKGSGGGSFKYPVVLIMSPRSSGKSASCQPAPPNVGGSIRELQRKGTAGARVRLSHEEICGSCPAASIRYRHVDESGI
jgi:hypothetical protein